MFNDDFDDYDIFAQMRKMMNRRFGGFFDDSLFNLDSEIADSNIQHENKKTKKVDRKFKIKSNKPTTKSYSISYKYETGKEPEIHYSGDIDEAMVKKYLERMQKQFGLNGISNKDIHLLGPDSEGIADVKREDKVADDTETPFIDMIDIDDGAVITLEMPGIKQDDVHVDFQEYGLIITAKGNGKSYRKEVSLKFKPIHNAKITANNGIITIEIKKTK